MSKSEVTARAVKDKFFELGYMEFVECDRSAESNKIFISVGRNNKIVAVVDTASGEFVKARFVKSKTASKKVLGDFEANAFFHLTKYQVDRIFTGVSVA